MSDTDNNTEHGVSFSEASKPLGYASLIRSMNGYDFLWLLLLACMWGSSLLWMNIILSFPGMDAIHVTAVRMFIAGVFFLAVSVFKSRIFTVAAVIRDNSGTVFILVILNVLVPFFLTSYSQMYISSSVSAIIYATMPIWANVIAHFAFTDEQLNKYRIGGIFLSFGGVVVLNMDISISKASGELFGQGLILLSGISLAIGTNYSRKVLSKDISSFSIIAAMFIMGSFIVLPVIWLFPGWLDVDWATGSGSFFGLLGSILMLGLFSTSLGYLVFFRIINVNGAGVSSMALLLGAVVANILAVLFLDEVLSLFMILGFALILLGLFIMNKSANKLEVKS